MMNQGIMGIARYQEGGDVDLSSLRDAELAFAQNLPTNLQDDYLAYVGLGPDASLQDIVNLSKSRGLSFEEAARATGLTASDPRYQTAFNLYQNGNDTDTSPGTLYPAPFGEATGYRGVPIGFSGPGGVMRPTIQQTPYTQLPQLQSGPSLGEGQTGGISLGDKLIGTTYVDPVTGEISHTPSESGLLGLEGDELTFAQNLPTDLQDDYLAYLDLEPDASLQDQVNLLKSRGLSFEEAARATGLTSSDPRYQTAADLYQTNTGGGLASLQSQLDELQGNYDSLLSQYEELRSLLGSGTSASSLRPFGTNRTPENSFLFDPFSPATNVGYVPPPVYYPFAYQSG